MAQTEFEPLEMLKTFASAIEADAIEADRISFIDENVDKVTKPLGSLIKAFQRSTDDLNADKDRRQQEIKDLESKQSQEEDDVAKIKELKRTLKRIGLSDYLDSHEVHEVGQQLWQELMSAALKDIDRHPKGNSGLFKYVDAATKFEDMLYGLESYYRDHTLHSLWVYLIGVLLMRNGGQLSSKNLNSGEGKSDSKDKECDADNLNWYLFNDIEQGKNRYPYPPILDDWAKFRNDCFHAQIQRHRDAIWCIIALCHDLGYSLAKLRGLNEKVHEVLKFFLIEDFKQVGYSLDIEQQYLIEQFLELMAMDVRINPGEDYENEKDWMRLYPGKQVITSDVFTKGIEDAQKKVLTKLKTCSKNKLDNFNFWEEFGNCKDVKYTDQAKKIEGQTLVKCYRDDSTYWRLCKALEKKEHGILSAYLLFKTLGTFADTSVRGAGEDWGLEDEEVIYNVIRGDILFAIAQHEFEYAHIDQLGSLAEILILCDELEEFTRLGRQLQSRKYHDTAAETRVEISNSKSAGNLGGAVLAGKWIDIKMTYIAKHNKSEDFFKFFARKCDKLCKLYSLGQRHGEGDPLYNPIGSITAEFKWDDSEVPDERWETLTFEMKEKTLYGELGKSKCECKKEEKEKCNEEGCSMFNKSEGRYKIECMDDKVLIKTKCTKEVTLRDWLGVENE